MKILVIGGGGREHALCWSIAQSPLCSKLYCAPGNPGISAVAECLPIAVDKLENIRAACRTHEITFVVIGPELPLTLGLADILRADGLAVFGPSKMAAQLEGSKSFMKEIAALGKVPTAAFQAFTDAEAAKAFVNAKSAPIVVKADGLAAGKGVTVAQTKEEALAAIDDAMVKKIFGDAGTSIVIEEFLEGEEVSFFALCDGKTALPFTTAQDHKAAYDGDKGPNTGGMGAYSPTPLVDQAMEDRIMKEIIIPTMKAMHDKGCDFSGILFAGLMITKTGPKLIEFNARFGDPETEAMLMRLKSDLLSVLYATSKTLLDGIRLEWNNSAALSVIMAAEGYPGVYKKGTVIKGLKEAAEVSNTAIFHAGTGLSASGEIIATGGRVLAVTGSGNTIAEAQKNAYEAIRRINWPEGFYRRDIGWRAIGKTKAA